MSDLNPYATQQPAAPLAPGTTVRPAKGWYLVGSGLILAAAASAVALAFPFFRDLFGPLDNLPNNGQVSVRLDGHASELVYLDDDVRADSISVPPCLVEHAATGFRPVVVEPDSGLSIDRGVKSYSAFASFRTGPAGDYRITCAVGTLDESGGFVLGRDPGGDLAGLGGGIAVGFLLAAAGITVCVVTGVRRSRFRRQGGVPLAQWGPQPPPPQWGQPVAPLDLQPGPTANPPLTGDPWSHPPS